jgi:uncharacterized protein (DUF362 family)/Pyruvate/2-oxoacid:ferredoxin oxidoreductase delta subunit
MKKKSKVAVIRCDSYNQSDVLPAIKRGFDFFGGPSSFVKKKERILLKPNVLSGADPSLCITTHPSVFEGVIKNLKKMDLILSYGDSPGMQPPGKALKKAEFYDIAIRHNIYPADFNNYKKVSSNKTLLKKEVPLAKGVLESDGLISICKLKTHGLTRMTGAVKNQYGCIPGLFKAKFHATYPFINDFTLLIVDINTLIQPRFYIMDAIFAMEGNGPQSGTPKRIGCLLFSYDPVALDAVACRIIDINPDFVPTCRIGQRAGLGTKNTEEIEIVGDSVYEFIDKSFDIIRKPVLAVKGNGVFSGINRLLLPKPFINSKMCIACGKCVKICPSEPKALQWKKDVENNRVPLYQYNFCTRCYCCHEACSNNAIIIKKPILSFIISSITLIMLGISAFRSIGKRIVCKIRDLV